jgi:soluble lytic murein transglycosylase-like protein
MATFTKLETFNISDLPYRFVYGKEDYSSPAVKQGNINILLAIKRNYGNSIKKWSDVFELGEPTISSFIAVESNGKMVGKNNAGAIGLTQVTDVLIRESISKFKIITKADLPKEAVTSIKLKAPFLLSLTPNNQELSASNISKLESLLKSDADFNIMMGSIGLRWGLEITKALNMTYLQKGIIAYNQSAYGDISRYKNKEVKTITLFKDTNIPKETRNYLVKVLGIDGFLQLYATENI